MSQHGPILGLIDLIGKNDLVVELGVYRGDSLDTILSNPKFLGEYIGIDLWQFDREIYANDSRAMRALIEAGSENAEPICRIKEEKYKNCTLIKENTHTASRHFPDNSIDFLFIDASHDFESVINDIESWYDKIKFDGYMAGDDYYSSGVKAAVDICLRKKRKIKVHTRSTLPGFRASSKGHRFWFFKKRRP